MLSQLENNSHLVCFRPKFPIDIIFKHLPINNSHLLSYLRIFLILMLCISSQTKIFAFVKKAAFSNTDGISKFTKPACLNLSCSLCKITAIVWFNCWHVAKFLNTESQKCLGGLNLLSEKY